MDHSQDELYIIEKVWPGKIVLATSASESSGEIHPVIWTNQYGKRLESLARPTAMVMKRSKIKYFWMWWSTA